MYDYSLLPNPNMEGGFRRYFEYGVRPGGHLEAILNNDLRTACARADVLNKHLLFAHVQWLYNQAPARSWGSKEAVDAWIKSTYKQQTVQESRDEH